jgi:NifU-like protein involved in Fe-S cluster formation
VDPTQLTPGGYSPVTVEHFRRPRNVGRLEDANAVGSIDDRATENVITIYLRVEGGTIRAARFRTFGCSACIAASSILTELIDGRSLAEARTVDVAAVDAALGGLPEAKRHCAELAARALAAALDSYVGN